jgi:ABC-type branched-subunit amino acid transport system substrate-binding protein
VARLALALGCCQLGFALLGCSETSRNYGPSVGVILDYTGTEANGFNEEQAFLLAADYMNGARSGDAPFRLLFKDARDNPDDARSAAQELVRDGVDIVIGPSTDRLVPTVKEVLDGTDVVLVSPNPTIGGLGTDERPWFRMSPGNLTGSTTPALIGEHMAAEFVNRGHRRALIVSDDDVYDVDLTQGFRSALVGRGGEVVQELSANDSQSQALAGALNQDSVDAVVVAAHLLPAAHLIAEAYLGAHTPPKWLLTPRLKSEVLSANTPFGSLDGAFGVSLRIRGRVSGCNAEFSEECFADAFERAWGGEPFENTYFMYDAAAIAFIAADRVWRENAGSIDRAQLREAIFATAERGGVLVGWNGLPRAVEAFRAGGNVQYSGVTGAIVFTPSGVRVGGETVVFEVNDDVFVDMAN